MLKKGNLLIMLGLFNLIGQATDFDPNQDLLDALDANPRTLAQVRAALDAGANPNTFDYNRATVLKIICSSIDNYSDDLEIVKLLIARGAIVNQSHSDCSNSLYIACINDKFEIVKYLLDCGANLDNAEPGETVLHIAISNRNYQMLQALLQAGANPDAITKTGETPLERAYSEDDQEAARILLEFEAWPHARISEEYEDDLDIEESDEDVLSVKEKTVYDLVNQNHERVVNSMKAVFDEGIRWSRNGCRRSWINAVRVAATGALDEDVSSKKLKT